jgi:NADPH:quinone reductase-like Zn-dependent oxidoreductase
MKAIVRRAYGAPEIVLTCEDVDTPLVRDDGVLIRVRAASVNPFDRHLIRGEPFFMRAFAGGLRTPKDIRTGHDVAGQIEAVGAKVTRFQPGQGVFGRSRGAFAEYVCAGENGLALKPATISFEQAGAVAIAGTTALQALRDKGRIQAGQRVLINGASGGVGTFAVQIARAFGADVSGVCSTRNVDMVRSLGASRVIDYTTEDFTRGRERYDLIIDAVGNRSMLECRRILRSTGAYVSVVGSPMAPLLSPFVSQRMVMLTLRTIPATDLAILKELMEAGQVAPVIDRTYSLSAVADAIRYIETGHARGKVAITIASS